MMREPGQTRFPSPHVKEVQVEAPQVHFIRTEEILPILSRHSDL